MFRLRKNFVCELADYLAYIAACLRLFMIMFC